MNWLDKLERKYGGRGIPNITRILIFGTLIGDLIGYAANYNAAAGLIYQMLAFNPALILKGQVWRLVTWLLMPTGGLSVWSILFMVCLLMLGQSMESGLGTFRMNMYFLGGVLLSDIGGMLIGVLSGFHISIYLTSYYLLFSLYLMLGIFMPEAEMRLYFVLPIKMKWLVIVYFVSLIFEVFEYFSYGPSVGIMMGAQIVFAVINLLWFVYSCKTHLSLRQQRKQHKRQHNFRQQFSQPRPGSGISQHKCCICGRTELDDPGLTFRYCSKCTGSREYCQEHLFTHEHM